MTQKIALITGATSGIGEATARLFAENNINLILCGRRKDRLNRLKEELSSKVRVHTLTFDISVREDVLREIGSLPDHFKNIDILVNNAGNAHGLSSIDAGDIDDWEKMIDINVKGLLYVSKAVIPHMVEKKSGQIINIGSIAGKEVYPNGNVYCASKHAVAALSDGMRIDLNPHGIRVSAIHPGHVVTEFASVRYKGDQSKADSLYKGFTPLLAQDIAEIILFSVTRPIRVNLADMLVLPTDQACSYVINRKL